MIKAGKESWVKPRYGWIIAKGEGNMQTYWLTMTDFHASEGEDDFSLEWDKLNTPPVLQNGTTVIETLCDEMTESDTCDFT